MGHGLGLEEHEYQDVSSTNTNLLEAGMVITIEPGIYVPNVAGVRIEDDILVTDTGLKYLHIIISNLKVKSLFYQKSGIDTHKECYSAFIELI